MNESENYLDQLLNAVDGRSDLNDSDPVNPEEIESKEQMPQKSTRETIDIPDSNDLFMDQFEQELRKDNDPDEFLKQFEQELDRDESSQGVTKAAQPMLDDIDQIMESVNQEAANDTAETAASAVEKTAEQKEDTAEVKNDEDGIDDLAIDDIGIDDFGLDDPETENEKAVSDEDDELMRILSGTGEDSEIPEADNAKAEVQPDDEVKEEKKPKKQGFLAKLSKLLFGDDEPDEEEISEMQAEPAVTEMPMDDMDILKELEGSSDGDKKGGKEKKKKEKKNEIQPIVFEPEEEEVRMGRPTVLLADQKKTIQGILRYEGNNQLSDLKIDTFPYVIGSAADCPGYVDCATISRHHAKITKVENVYFIEDMNSANGTKAGGTLLDYKMKVSLQANEILEFADEKFRFI